MTAPVLNHGLTSGYDLMHAYWLCKAAFLAYKDEDEIRAETATWGFDQFKFFYSKHLPPFPLDDTQTPRPTSWPATA